MKIEKIWCPEGMKNDGRYGYPKPSSLNKEANKIRKFVNEKYNNNYKISSTPHDDHRVEEIDGKKYSRGYIEITNRVDNRSIAEIDTIESSISFSQPSFEHILNDLITYFNLKIK